MCVPENFGGFPGTSCYVDLSGPNVAPVANFSVSALDGIAPVTINFDASSSSDANGDPLTYMWDFDDGGIASGVTVSRTFSAAGIYTVRLSVIDTHNGMGVHYAMITVNETNPGNTRPVASFQASPRGGFAPVLSTLDAAASTDADGDALTYSWHISGPTGEQLGRGPTQFFNFTQPGRYPIRLGVEDGNGGAHSVTDVILVRNPADPACKMEVLDLGTSFSGEILLSNYGTAPISGWEVWWQLGAGTAITSSFNVNLAGSNPYIATPASFNSVIEPGRWISFGFQGTKPATLVPMQPVEVMGNICDNRTPPPVNNPPVAALTATPTSGPAPLTVRFDASGSSDPDGDPLTYSWNWGDGTSTSGLTSPITSHVYGTSSSGGSSGGAAAPLVRRATLTVSDGRGGSATKTIDIMITPPDVRLSCSVQVAGLWSNGYQLNVNVSNTGTAVGNNVCVFLNFPEPTQLTASWGGASVSSASSNMIRICLNGPLNPGQTVSTGVQGTHDGSFTPPTCSWAVP